MNDVECMGDEAQILNCDHVLYDFDTGKNKLDNASVAGVDCPGMATSMYQANLQFFYVVTTSTSTRTGTSGLLINVCWV